MPNDAQRFRSRAKDCRRLAGETMNADDKRTLTEMADELDAEADRIEAEGTKPQV